MADNLKERARRLSERAISQPLVTHMYTADPSAHVFEGRIYIYPSHDIDAGIPFNDNGDHFGMEDYHVLSMERPDGPVTDHGMVLHVKDVPWAARQMWAPTAACKDGRYYLYFPAKDADGIFRLGVATSDGPAGPFTAEPRPIPDGYSIDPAAFEDKDEAGESAHYLYFGGIWGGQLQKFRDNVFDAAHGEPAPHEPALPARVARLSADMKTFAEPPRAVVILDEHGNELLAGDHARRYFEGPWVHKYGGKYYFSYSTGDTHLLCYATGDSPYGPFTYQGTIMTPVIGWTTHHSIVEVDGRWFLFYHDSSLSGGVTHLRCAKVTELHHDEDGRIVTVHPYGEPDAGKA